MNKIDYIFAAIYKSFAGRLKNDTPYFNLIMSLVLILFVHIMQLIVLLKLFGVDLFDNISKGLFLILFVAFCTVTILIIKTAFPLKKISQIEVASHDIKKYNARLISYSLLSILLLIVLFIILKNKIGI